MRLAGAGVMLPLLTSHRSIWMEGEKDVLSPYDFHATILHLLGLDHERLSYYHNGIERRLTDVRHVVSDLIARFSLWGLSPVYPFHEIKPS